jgi:hypothetical protein
MRFTISYQHCTAYIVIIVLDPRYGTLYCMIRSRGNATAMYGDIPRISEDGVAKGWGYIKRARLSLRTLRPGRVCEDSSGGTRKWEADVLPGLIIGGGERVSIRGGH